MGMSCLQLQSQCEHCPHPDVQDETGEEKGRDTGHLDGGKRETPVSSDEPHITWLGGTGVVLHVPRSQRHSDGLFTSEYSKMRGNAQVQKFIQNLMGHKRR